MATADAYIELLCVYLNNNITTDEFESKFFYILGRDEEEHSNDVYSVIDRLSGYVDGYSDDPELFPDMHVDEAELKERCTDALDKLIKLTQKYDSLKASSEELEPVVDDDAEAGGQIISGRSTYQNKKIIMVIILSLLAAGCIMLWLKNAP